MTTTPEQMLFVICIMDKPIRAFKNKEDALIVFNQSSCSHQKLVEIPVFKNIPTLLQNKPLKASLEEPEQDLVPKTPCPSSLQPAYLFRKHTYSRLRGEGLFCKQIYSECPPFKIQTTSVKNFWRRESIRKRLLREAKLER